MMTLEVAILYHTEEAEKLKLHKRVNEIILGSEGYKRELQEHTQTAEWLKILKKAKFEYDEAWRIITHPTPDVTYADRNRAQIILDTFRNSLGGVERMSYFPCDIPYMSKEELEENGIRIPKDNTEKKQEQPEIIRCKDCIFYDPPHVENKGVRIDYKDLPKEAFDVLGTGLVSVEYGINIGGRCCVDYYCKNYSDDKRVYVREDNYCGRAERRTDGSD